MSTYESYDQAASAYERYRRPVATEVITGCLLVAGKPLQDLEVLDAGCGTGNYAVALAPMVKQITGLDLSTGMLSHARAKAAARLDGPASLVFHQGSMDDLPFATKSFDAVMFNQVLHHLESGEDASYPGHRRALNEAYRVLRPGGVVVVNYCSHRQLRQGFWYYHLIPEATEKVLARCAPSGRIGEILTDVGFQRHDRVVSLDAVMQADSYFDPLGPLDPAWRLSDSIWALASAEEVARAEAEVRSLEQQNLQEQRMLARDATRPSVGQMTFAVARRPA